MKHHIIRFFAFVAACLLLSGALISAGAPIKIKVTAELANIRQKPSISSPIIRQFPEGTILEATVKEGEWYMVTMEPDESGATAGYVHESLVLPLGEEPKKEVQTKIEEPVAKKEPEKVQKTEPVVVERQKPEVIREEPGAPINLALALFAGFNFIPTGDLNTGAQGLADLYAGTISGAAGNEVQPARRSFMLGGEISIPVAPQLFITAGADFLKTAPETLLSFVKTGTTNFFTARPEIQAIPLKFGLAFYPTEFIYVKFGASYYFAKCGYYFRYEHDKFWQEWNGSATAQGLGAWGGVGFEVALSETFAFVGEATGQYAPLKGFEGTGTYLDSNTKVTVTEEGKLYAYTARTSTQTAYPLAYIRSRLPSEGGVENARVAQIDFSGVSVRAGIKIKF